MEITKIISSNILRLLDEKKIPALSLAHHLGITRQTLTNYLKGNSIVDSVKLVQIANFFGVAVDDLITNSINQKLSFLFRTALNYQIATDDLQTEINEYIRRYVSLAKSLNKNVCFLPEQYNLSVQYEGNIIDVNFECTDYTAPKLKIDAELDSEIERIADEQRRLIGIGEKGAISFISSLIQRGVNIIFRDFFNPEISGLSICDDSLGCYIFVNDEMTVERQIFTIAHEYAHIILHRPLYKRRMEQYFNPSKNKNLLDSMADCFAGYLLCPRRSLLTNKTTLQNFKSLSELLPIKKEMQISLSSLIMAMKRDGYINYSAVSSYFSFLQKKGLEKKELEPLLDDEIVRNNFILLKTSTIQKMLKLALNKNILRVEDIQYFLNLTKQEAEDCYKQWQDEWNNIKKASDSFGDLVF